MRTSIRRPWTASQAAAKDQRRRGARCTASQTTTPRIKPDVEELVAELDALAKRLAPLSEEAAGEEPASFVELLMGNWDGFDMQAELHPGFVPGACAAEVPGEPLGDVQEFDAEALVTV